MPTTLLAHDVTTEAGASLVSPRRAVRVLRVHGGDDVPDGPAAVPATRTGPTSLTDERTDDRTDEMVLTHVALVGKAMRETLSRVPSHVSRDDLTSAGMLALLQAARSFDTERGTSFAAHASRRIRGAMLDELRGLDWASRSVRRRAREVEECRGRLATGLGRPADDAEVCEALGITRHELAAHQEDLARASVVSLHAYQERSDDDLLPTQSLGPADVVERREQVAYLHDAVAQLPRRLRVVVEGYFFHDRPMADLAAELGVSESRVSQLRAEAVVLLRGALTAVLDPESAALSAPREGCAARRRQDYYASVASRRSYAARLSHPDVYAESRTA